MKCRPIVRFLAAGAFCALLAVESAGGESFPVEFLLVDSQAQAASLLERLKQGEDFAALAHKYSTDPTANDGGYLGDVDPDNLRLELRDALKGIAPGQHSDVVKLPNGYAILKRLRTPEPAPTATDPARLLAVSSQSSARLTVDASGYQELMQTMRGMIAPSWGRDLKQVCETRKQASMEGIAAMREQMAMPDEQKNRVLLTTDHYTLAGLYASSGQLDKALPEWEGASRIAKAANSTKQADALEEILGMGYLHRASTPDPSDRTPINTGNLIPSHPGAGRINPADVTRAIEHLTAALAKDPSNTEVRWLLNLAYMIAGKYPEGVPKAALIPPSVFASKQSVGRFADVAPAAGVDVFGTAGGAVADDFDNDGLLDIVTSQVDDCAAMHFFHNNGDGTFADRTAQAGLADQTGGLNLIHADYNNDGCPDLLVLRGGWEFPRRRSLLRNNCNGTFTDVTAASGLLEPIRASQSAVWADIDNDGKLDLFVANENSPAQLFLNLDDGTFVDIAKEAGVDRSAISKAVAAGDYDNDGYVDFYVSNSNGDGYLYHNNGDRTFTEVSAKAGVHASRFAFAHGFSITTTTAARTFSSPAITLRPRSPRAVTWGSRAKATR